MIWEQIITQMEAEDASKSDAIGKRPHRQKKKYYLSHDDPNDYLTTREKECMDHLILGRTIKESAKHMQLSPRTVEFYLKNIRKRWGCKTKGQVIEKMQRHYQSLR